MSITSEKTASDDSSRIVAHKRGGPRYPLFPLPLLPSGPGGVHSRRVTRDHNVFTQWVQAAEGEGFEPSVPFSTHDFQSCTFGHSVIPPHEGQQNWAEGEGFEPPVLSHI